MRAMPALPSRMLLSVFLAAPLAVGWPSALPPAAVPATLTVLFDNTSREATCTAGWGFSALIEGVGRTILFDAGAEEPVFEKNVRGLHVDLKQVDLVFISHDHGDHTGGLGAMLRTKPGVPVLVPAGAAAAFQAKVLEGGGRLTTVKEPEAIVAGVWSTGDLGQAIHEQALVIDTPRGLVVVTGCAHPGIVSMLEAVKAARKKDIWMVLGGFHLVQTPPDRVEAIVARFKAMGVQRVGATHCTGAAAIESFRRAFGAGFVELGVGARLPL
jgi:7,8-dihydropterin-6-yl-methyl-4-(beta-D-ribofuranosyl)aminobenzene 5'-phosphate synthase